MQYVMLVRVDPELPVPETGADPEAWVAEGARTGMRLEGNGLESPETATTVRVRDGRTLITDGPFAETKEVVAGYDLLEAPDLEAAVGYAAEHPVAAFGALEVREVWADFIEAGAERPRPVETGTDYLFLHTADPELLARTTWREGDPTAWVQRVAAERATLGGYRLHDATPRSGGTVRRRGGETLVTRGPFAEVAEQVSGIDLVRAADLDAALELAAAHPTARIGAIEVRPFWSA